jgi:hypothetical protein
VGFGKVGANTHYKEKFFGSFFQKRTACLALALALLQRGDLIYFNA